MKKKYFISICIFAALVLIGSVLASADSEFFVNDASSPLPRFFEGVYAVGSGGMTGKGFMQGTQNQFGYL